MPSRTQAASESSEKPQSSTPNLSKPYSAPRSSNWYSLMTSHESTNRDNTSGRPVTTPSVFDTKELLSTSHQFQSLDKTQTSDILYSSGSSHLPSMIQTDSSLALPHLPITLDLPNTPILTGTTSLSDPTRSSNLDNKLTFTTIVSLSDTPSRSDVFSTGNSFSPSSLSGILSRSDLPSTQNSISSSSLSGLSMSFRSQGAQNSIGTSSLTDHSSKADMPTTRNFIGISSFSDYPSRSDLPRSPMHVSTLSSTDRPKSPALPVTQNSTNSTKYLNHASISDLPFAESSTSASSLPGLSSTLNLSSTRNSASTLSLLDILSSSDVSSTQNKVTISPFSGLTSTSSFSGVQTTQAPAYLSDLSSSTDLQNTTDASSSQDLYNGQNITSTTSNRSSNPYLNTRDSITAVPLSGLPSSSNLASTLNSISTSSLSDFPKRSDSPSTLNLSKTSSQPDQSKAPILPTSSPLDQFRVSTLRGITTFIRSSSWSNSLSNTSFNSSGLTAPPSNSNVTITPSLSTSSRETLHTFPNTAATQNTHNTLYRQKHTDVTFKITAKPTSFGVSSITPTSPQHQSGTKNNIHVTTMVPPTTDVSDTIFTMTKSSRVTDLPGSDSEVSAMSTEETDTTSLVTTTEILSFGKLTSARSIAPYSSIGSKLGEDTSKTTVALSGVTSNKNGYVAQSSTGRGTEAKISQSSLSVPYNDYASPTMDSSISDVKNVPKGITNLPTPGITTGMLMTEQGISGTTSLFSTVSSAKNEQGQNSPKTPHISKLVTESITLAPVATARSTSPTHRSLLVFTNEFTTTNQDRSYTASTVRWHTTGASVRPEPISLVATSHVPRQHKTTLIADQRVTATTSIHSVSESHINADATNKKDIATTISNAIQLGTSARSSEGDTASGTTLLVPENATKTLTSGGNTLPNLPPDGDTHPTSTDKQVLSKSTISSTGLDTTKPSPNKQVISVTNPYSKERGTSARTIRRQSIPATVSISPEHGDSGSTTHREVTSDKSFSIQGYSTSLPTTGAQVSTITVSANTELHDSKHKTNTDVASSLSSSATQADTDTTRYYSQARSRIYPWTLEGKSNASATDEYAIPSLPESDTSTPLTDRNIIFPVTSSVQRSTTSAITIDREPTVETPTYSSGHVASNGPLSYDKTAVSVHSTSESVVSEPIISVTTSLSKYTSPTAAYGQSTIKSNDTSVSPKSKNYDTVPETQVTSASTFVTSQSTTSRLLDRLITSTALSTSSRLTEETVVPTTIRVRDPSSLMTDQDVPTTLHVGDISSQMMTDKGVSTTIPQHYSNFLTRDKGISSVRTSLTHEKDVSELTIGKKATSATASSTSERSTQNPTTNTQITSARPPLGLEQSSIAGGTDRKVSSKSVAPVSRVTNVATTEIHTETYPKTVSSSLLERDIITMSTDKPITTATVSSVLKLDTTIYAQASSARPSSFSERGTAEPPRRTNRATSARITTTSYNSRKRTSSSEAFAAEGQPRTSHTPGQSIVVTTPGNSVKKQTVITYVQSSFVSEMAEFNATATAKPGETATISEEDTRSTIKVNGSSSAMRSTISGETQHSRTSPFDKIHNPDFTYITTTDLSSQKSLNSSTTLTTHNYTNNKTEPIALHFKGYSTPSTPEYMTSNTVGPGTPYTTYTTARSATYHTQWRLREHTLHTSKMTASASVTGSAKVHGVESSTPLLSTRYIRNSATRSSLSDSSHSATGITTKSSSMTPYSITRSTAQNHSTVDVEMSTSQYPSDITTTHTTPAISENHTRLLTAYATDSSMGHFGQSIVTSRNSKRSTIEHTTNEISGNVHMTSTDKIINPIPHYTTDNPTQSSTIARHTNRPTRPQTIGGSTQPGRTITRSINKSTTTQTKNTTNDTTMLSLLYTTDGMTTSTTHHVNKTTARPIAHYTSGSAIEPVTQHITQGITDLTAYYTSRTTTESTMEYTTESIVKPNTHRSSDGSVRWSTDYARSKSTRPVSQFNIMTQANIQTTSDMDLYSHKRTRSPSIQSATHSTRMSQTQYHNGDVIGANSLFTTVSSKQFTNQHTSDSTSMYTVLSKLDAIKTSAGQYNTEYDAERTSDPTAHSAHHSTERSTPRHITDDTSMGSNQYTISSSTVPTLQTNTDNISFATLYTTDSIIKLTSVHSPGNTRTDTVKYTTEGITIPTTQHSSTDTRIDTPQYITEGITLPTTQYSSRVTRKDTAQYSTEGIAKPTTQNVTLSSSGPTHHHTTDSTAVVANTTRLATQSTTADTAMPDFEHTTANTARYTDDNARLGTAHVTAHMARITAQRTTSNTALPSDQQTTTDAARPTGWNTTAVTAGPTVEYNTDGTARHNTRYITDKTVRPNNVHSTTDTARPTIQHNTAYATRLTAQYNTINTAKPRTPYTTESIPRFTTLPNPANTAWRITQNTTVNPIQHTTGSVTISVSEYATRSTIKSLTHSTDTLRKFTTHSGTDNTKCPTNQYNTNTSNQIDSSMKSTAQFNLSRIASVIRRTTQFITGNATGFPIQYSPDSTTMYRELNSPRSAIVTSVTTKPSSYDASPVTSNPFIHTTGVSTRSIVQQPRDSLYSSNSITQFKPQYTSSITLKPKLPSSIDNPVQFTAVHTTSALESSVSYYHDYATNSTLGPTNHYYSHQGTNLTSQHSSNVTTTYRGVIAIKTALDIHTATRSIRSTPKIPSTSAHMPTHPTLATLSQVATESIFRTPLQVTTRQSPTTTIPSTSRPSYFPTLRQIVFTVIVPTPSPSPLPVRSARPSQQTSRNSLITSGPKVAHGATEDSRINSGGTMEPSGSLSRSNIITASGLVPPTRKTERKEQSVVPCDAFCKNGGTLFIRLTGCYCGCSGKWTGPTCEG